MKKLLKLTSLVLSVALFVVCFAACGGNKAADDTVLTMATSADFPPYEFYEDDKIVGIDVDIMTKVCEKIGMTLEPQDMSFDSVIGAAQTGKTDIAMSGITVTEDRKNMVDFTIPYTSTAQSIIVVKGGEIAAKADRAVRCAGGSAACHDRTAYRGVGYCPAAAAADTCGFRGRSCHPGTAAGGLLRGQRYQLL